MGGNAPRSHERWIRSKSSTAANAGAALVLGFSYWVVLALAMSLGRSGVLPPAVAAFSANAIRGARYSSVTT